MSRNLDRDPQYGRDLFYRRDFLGAYSVFRRLYDRLPFEATPAHAEYIAYFSRTLLELGKEYELKFYLKEIERLYEKTHTLELGYQLASVCATGPAWALDYGKARSLLEGIVRNTSNRRSLARAKMLLAYVFDCEAEDVASCRALIYSIEKVEDEEIDSFVEIWKAKILRDEKKYDEAKGKLEGLLKRTPFEENWYAHFSILNILAILHLRTGAIEKGLEIHATLKTLFAKKKMCVTQRGLNALESELRKISTIGKVFVSPLKSGWEICFGKERHLLSRGSAAERLFRHLLKESFVEKTAIIELLFNRAYDSSVDDKTIQYHVRNLRKFMLAMGIPSSAIALEENGYRFIPEVQFVEI